MAGPPNQTPPPTDAADDRRRVSASTERNRGPILEILERVLPDAGLVLEIGAGTGEHAATFAPRFPGLVWQPTDPDPDMRASIAAWVEETKAPNLKPPIDLDVTAEDWPVSQAAVVFSANMIHIAPWDCCLGLLAGAGRVLTARGPGGSGVSPGKNGGSGVSPGNKDGGTPDRETTTSGILVIYGPFKVGGRHTADSNARFDASLRERDPAWGVRDLDDVARAALAQGLRITETVRMPANNLTVIFKKEA